MSVFIKDGNFCIIPTNLYEIPERNTYRGYAIISQKPTNQNEFDKYYGLSNYLLNIKFLKCVYDDNIKNKCNEMEKNIMKSSV